MKLHTMINMIAGIGLVVGPLNAMASDFGGGLVRDKNTGTTYNANAGYNMTQHSGTSKANSEPNSYGGGLVQNKLTGTTYNSNAGYARMEQSHTAEEMQAKNEQNSVGGS